MITVKLPYEIIESGKQIKEQHYKLIHTMQDEFSKVVRWSYNRWKEETDLSKLKRQNELAQQTKTLNNINTIDTWIRMCAVARGYEIRKKNGNKKVVFGGKFMFNQFREGNIDKATWKENRVKQLFVQGEKSQIGNRKYDFHFNA